MSDDEAAYVALNVIVWAMGCYGAKLAGEFLRTVLRGPL